MPSPVSSNTQAAYNAANSYLASYAATRRSARRSTKVDLNEIKTYWEILTSSGNSRGSRAKAARELKEQLADFTLTAGAEAFYNRIVNTGGYPGITWTAPRVGRNSGVGV